MDTRQNGPKEMALVTGASAGIGNELARVLAANGHPLVIVALDQEKLKTLAGELQSEYRVPVRVFAKDLSEPGAAQALWSELTEPKLKIDDKVIVNGYLARDGSHMVDGRSVTMADGRKILAGPAN